MFPICDFILLHNPSYKLCTGRKCDKKHLKNNYSSFLKEQNQITPYLTPHHCHAESYQFLNSEINTIINAVMKLNQ